jgi:hypothetical protein
VLAGWSEAGFEPAARRGFIRPGAKSGPIGIRWFSTYWDEEIASGTITADMSGEHEGLFPNTVGQFGPIARRRHFGEAKKLQRIRIARRRLQNPAVKLAALATFPLW